VRRRRKLNQNNKTASGFSHKTANTTAKSKLQKTKERRKITHWN
jgi:hypothetical protein